MPSEAAAVDLVEAQKLFESLPQAMQWPTLSPAYVAADAARDDALRALFLASREGDGLLMHMVHESPIGHDGSCDWQSAYGYGGPLAHGLDGEALKRAWRQLDDTARRRGVVAEFVRFHPGVGNHLSYPGTVREDRRVVQVDLRVDDLMSSYDGRARTAIRKAERDGLQAEWQTAAQACARFPDFYRECMREIGATDFYLFRDEYFERLIELPGARVLAIRRDGLPLSMGLFLFGPKQVEYHLSGTLRAARQCGATNLLLHAAARAGQQSGCSVLFLGGGTSGRPDDPLLRFKASFADPALVFRIGHRVHDTAAYERLRSAHPAKAAGGRVLFYRS